MQDIFGMGRKKTESKQKHEKRLVFETIVSFFAKGKECNVSRPYLNDCKSSFISWDNCSMLACAWEEDSFYN